MKERLAKFIADCGVASRRRSEDLIKSGKVFVNKQQVITPICFVDENDSVVIEGKELKKNKEIKLYKFYKPINTMTTTKDPQGRKTIYSILPKEYRHLKYVGRLDYKTTGLLLLTNSGDLACKLSSPKNHVSRTYIATVKQYTESGLKIASAGTTVDGIFYKPMIIKKINKNTLGVTVEEGKKNEIRIVLKSVGSPVIELHRVSFGNIELGNLSVGEIQEIPKKTVDLLLKSF
ncbi:MAG: pseudouridine synthase [Alphaproteobacteria bacterium]|nr:pseudouridine synthase [Alphaproteobacteria bacterium]